MRAAGIDEGGGGVDGDLGADGGERKADMLLLRDGGADLDERVIRAEAGLADVELVGAEGEKVDGEAAARIAKEEAVVAVGSGSDFNGGANGSAGGIADVDAQLSAIGLGEGAGLQQ